MSEQWAWIEQSGDTCGGACRIRGTRISVRMVASLFMGGDSIAEIAKGYELPPAAIEEALQLFMVSLRGQTGENVERDMRKRIGLMRARREAGR